MDDDIKKRVDETWKNSVAKEKNQVKPEKEFTLPLASFSFFISTLALQGSIFLGIVPNPATNKKEKNLEQAKFIIDTLDMLQEKTKNNLNDEEIKLLENMLYELKMQYISISKEAGND